MRFEDTEHSDKVNIFVAYHKPSSLIKNEVLVPIHVGRDTLNPENEEDSLVLEVLSEYMIGDNTGDNISAKNKYYCELTAMYWVWKNVKTDYVGIAHYRRLFDFNGADTPPFGAEESSLLEIFKDCDVILTDKNTLFEPSLYQQFINSHDASVLDFALEYIKEKYPDMSYDADNIKVVQYAYFWNMLVAKKDIYDNYCEWLFDILNAYDNYVASKGEELQPRMNGFVAERLFNIYFNHYTRIGKLRCKEYPCVMLV